MVYERRVADAKPSCDAKDFRWRCPSRNQMPSGKSAIDGALRHQEKGAKGLREKLLRFKRLRVRTRIRSGLVRACRTLQVLIDSRSMSEHVMPDLMSGCHCLTAGRPGGCNQNVR